MLVGQAIPHRPSTPLCGHQLARAKNRGNLWGQLNFLLQVVPVPAFNGLTWSCPLENLGQGVNLTVAANNLTCAINTSCSVIATVTQVPI